MGFASKTPRLIGGRLCLDFANTADWCEGRVVLEDFETPADLLAWGRHLALPGAEAGEQEAAAALGPLRRLRAALYRLFTTSGEADPADLAVLNRWLAQPLALRPGPGGRLVLAAADPAAADLAAAIAGPVALSAAELLAGGGRAWVRRCPGENCGWLFLDESRGGRRRWCAMETCGNRAKARAHYRRRRAVEAEGTT